MAASVHLRGIVIAGALAALALGLGFVTLVMNQSASHPAPHVIIPLKDRHHAPGRVAAARKPAAAVTTKKTVAVRTKKTVAVKAKTTVAAKAKTMVAAKTKKTVAVKRPDPNLVAALKAGLPRVVAAALAKRPVVVVELSSNADPVGKLSAAEAEAGAALAGAGFVGVNIDRDGGTVGTLTTALGKLPDAPAALIYVRPAKLTLTLAGFADRTVVQQAAASAAPPLDASVIAASSDWAAKVNAICTTTFAKVNAVGGAAKLKPGQGLTIYGGMYKKIAAVTPPAGSAAAVRSANALLKKALGMGARTHAKVAAGQVGLPLYLHTLDVLHQSLAKYNKLGASGCTAS
jgi:hypothetical protein